MTNREKHEAVAALLPGSEVVDDGAGPYVMLPPSFGFRNDTRAELFIYAEDGWWRYQLAGEVVEISECHAGTPPAEVVAWVTALPEN